MNQKDMFLFNSVKSVQFLKTFRPTSTPFNEFSSPGLSNVNIHSFLIQSHFNSPKLVYQKETKEENKKTEFVQEGKGVSNEKFMYNPIQVERTILEEEDKSLNKDDKVDNAEILTNDDESQQNEQQQQQQSVKRKKSETDVPAKKKSKFMFKIVD